MRLAIAAFLLALILPAFPAEEDDWGAPARDAAAPGRSIASPVPSPRALSSETARRIQLLKVRANGLYRSRKYREAVDLYAACARLDPGDADARNDMAVCYQKLKVTDSALACARDALRLADARLVSDDTAGWSFADLRARKNAYFLIDKLGSPMTAPKPGQCESWTASEGECRARLRVCSERGSRPAPGGALRWDILRASISLPKALFGDEEKEAPSMLPRPELRDMEESSIDGVSEGFMRWVNRDSAATMPLGEFLETSDSACAGPACGGLEKELIECRILHFDACAGVVGMACAYQENGGPDRIVIGESYFLPAR